MLIDFGFHISAVLIQYVGDEGSERSALRHDRVDVHRFGRSLQGTSFNTYGKEILALNGSPSDWPNLNPVRKHRLHRSAPPKFTPKKCTNYVQYTG
jgi:hypothetical protein